MKIESMRESSATDDRVVLARAVAHSAGSTDPDAFALVLARRVGTPADYEASVRLSSDGRIISGRMMIEQAPADLVPTIAHALDVRLPTDAARWMDLATAEGVPLIAGWDRRDGAGGRCVKLYVNASDAGADKRARLCERLLPGVPANESAAVIGMNVRADGGIESKLYVQSADAAVLAAPLGSAAIALAQSAAAQNADAGGVLSYDALPGELRPRAFFVALREPPPGRAWSCVTGLPGWDADAAEVLLPFPPAQPRSIGVSLTDGRWTLYAKPRDSFRAPEALEPFAVFRTDSGEVGVFVEPNEHARRAFRRTDAHAVSIRIREGEPVAAVLEALVDWFAARLSAAEQSADWSHALAGNLHDPPAPWQPAEIRGRAD